MVFNVNSKDNLYHLEVLKGLTFVKYSYCSPKPISLTESLAVKGIASTALKGMEIIHLFFGPK